MNHEATPSLQDYRRWKRAIVGVLVIVLAELVTGLSFPFMWSSGDMVEGLLALLYIVPLVIAIVAVARRRFTPEDDPTCERFVKGTTTGRRACLCLGVGLIGVGLLVIPNIPGDSGLFSTWFAVSGLAFALWSFQFPQVALPKDHPQYRKPWQFSLRALLVVTLLVAVYVKVALRSTNPDHSMLWRLSQPVVAVAMLTCAAGFVTMLIQLVVLPIRCIWGIVGWMCGRHMQTGRDVEATASVDSRPG